MTKSKNRPAAVVDVPTYGELEQYARAFADGHLNLLILCGDPGIGKSQCLRRALNAQACWIDGNASAFGIYLQAHRYRNQPMVLDDVDGLYRDRQGIRLLKTLCQTDPVKTVSWQTAATGGGIPMQFTTTSRVAVIANQWHTLSADVAALEDRGHCLQFAPSAAEVHRHAAQWFWDQPVFDFVAAHLHVIPRHSLRTYVLAWELKKAGMNWRQAVLSRCLKGTALEVAKLKTNPSFQSEEDRVRAFVAAGLGCRATYFNYAKKLQPHESLPEIKLMQTSPPQEVHADYLDLLVRRFGPLGNG